MILITTMDDYYDIFFFCDSPRLRPAAADGLHLGRPGDAGGGVGVPGVLRRPPASSADKFGSIHDGTIIGFSGSL